MKSEAKIYKETRKRRRDGGTTMLTCSNCKKSLISTMFSKKQRQRRNCKNLLCLPCLGQPIPQNSSDSNNRENSATKEKSSSHPRSTGQGKRECYECGKLLQKERFSSKQLRKSEGKCMKCVQRNKFSNSNVVCQSCKLPKARPGFSSCRDCHFQNMQTKSNPTLPGGIRYEVPNFRDSRRMTFHLSKIPTEILIGCYDIIYLSIDKNWSRDPVLSTTAQGSITIQPIMMNHYGEENIEASTTLQGEINLKHPTFQKKIDSMKFFQIVKTKDDEGDIDDDDDDFTIPTSLLEGESNSSFFMSHVHQFAPDTTWHDPSGDIYTQHHGLQTSKRSVGKMKLLSSKVSLPLEQQQRKQQQQQQSKSRRRRIAGDKMMERYQNVSNYWICNHLDMPDDVARMIRQFVCPPPVLTLLPDDLFLVSSSRGKKEGDWSEVMVVGRKQQEEV